jgi:hypothetical protein
MVDEDKLNQLIGKMLGRPRRRVQRADGANGRPARLYKALEKRPMTSKELAKETGIAERYAREWLSHQAASGHLDYDPVCGAFTLTPEQAMVVANSNNSRSICKARSTLRSRSLKIRRRLNRRFKPARASVGAIKLPASFAMWDAFSGRATRTTSYPVPSMPA